MLIRLKWRSFVKKKVWRLKCKGLLLLDKKMKKGIIILLHCLDFYIKNVFINKSKYFMPFWIWIRCYWFADVFFSLLQMVLSSTWSPRQARAQRSSNLLRSLRSSSMALTTPSLVSESGYGYIYEDYSKFQFNVHKWLSLVKCSILFIWDAKL